MNSDLPTYLESLTDEEYAELEAAVDAAPVASIELRRVEEQAG